MRLCSKLLCGQRFRVEENILEKDLWSSWVLSQKAQSVSPQNNLDMQKWLLDECLEFGCQKMHFSYSCAYSTAAENCFLVSALLIPGNVSKEGKAIGSVRLSISTLSSEPSDLWPWSFARVWVTTIARPSRLVQVKRQNAVGVTSSEGNQWQIQDVVIGLGAKWRVCGVKPPQKFSAGGTSPIAGSGGQSPTPEAEVLTHFARC